MESRAACLIFKLLKSRRKQERQCGCFSLRDVRPCPVWKDTSYGPLRSVQIVGLPGDVHVASGGCKASQTYSNADGDDDARLFCVWCVIRNLEIFSSAKDAFVYLYVEYISCVLPLVAG